MWFAEPGPLGEQWDIFGNVADKLILFLPTGSVFNCEKAIQLSWQDNFMCEKKEVLRGVIPFRRVTLTSQHYRERWWFYSPLYPCLNYSFGASDTSLRAEKSAKQNSKPNRGQFSNCRSVGSLPKNRVGAQTESNPQLPSSLNGRKKKNLRRQLSN